MKYYDYNELKDLILINKEYQEKFREQTDLEKRNLKEDLIFHKRILSPLQVRLSINGLVLIDGHHRWELLPEVIKECPEFNLKIPVVVIKLDDIADVMLRTQLGRRNLSNEDIKQYVDRLITEDGLSKNKAYEEVSKKTGFSKSKVKRIVQPELAEAHRASQKIRDTNKKLSQMNNFSPETTEISLEEKERRSEKQRQSKINKKMEEVSSSWEGNLLDTKQLVEYEDKPYYDEVLANGSKYRTYINKEDYINSEEYISGAPVNSNNQHTSVPECERLVHIKDKIKDLQEHLPYFEDSAIYPSMKTFVDTFYNTLDS